LVRGYTGNPEVKLGRPSGPGVGSRKFVVPPHVPELVVSHGAVTINRLASDK